MAYLKSVKVSPLVAEQLRILREQSGLTANQLLDWALTQFRGSFKAPVLVTKRPLTCCDVHREIPWAYSPTCPSLNNPPAGCAKGCYWDLVFRDDALTEVVAMCENCGLVRVYTLRDDHDD